MCSVDVIIPVYKPGEKFKKLLIMLKKQTVQPNKIIIFNTEQSFFDNFFYGTNFLDQFDNLEIRHISRYEFDHGGTRKSAVALSDSDYFICMTDDAIPKDKYLIQNLLVQLVNENAAVSYACQCVGKKSTDIERFTHKFNYPEKSFFKSSSDIDKLGIKTYFCSNVCACYNRKIYDELGGFIKKTIFNEDMIFASKVIKAGYSIYYASEAKVIHNHHYSNISQLKRNFDLGVSQANNPEIFDEVPSTSEGKKLVSKTAKYLIEKKKYSKLITLFVMSAYKYIGYQLGKHYKNIPKKIILKITMNPMYWMKPDRDISIDPSYGYGRSHEEDKWNKK